MSEEQFTVKELTDKDKQFLKSKTTAFLPDNPSDKRFSASQIKMKTYEPDLILFEWLKGLAAETNIVVTNIKNEVTELQQIAFGITLRVEETDYVIPEEDK